MQTYGDWNYQSKPFVMPSDSAAAVSVDKAAEEAKEDRLMDAASKVAAAPAVSMDERRKQAWRAAGRRFKSEAETRYLIDEQLRKVGWEADTEKLRYSKGTRPAKGHDMLVVVTSVMINHWRRDNEAPAFPWESRTAVRNRSPLPQCSARCRRNPTPAPSRWAPEKGSCLPATRNRCPSPPGAPREHPVRCRGRSNPTRCPRLRKGLSPSQNRCCASEAPVYVKSC